MNMTLMYNGKQFAPVSTQRSVVVPYDAEIIWSVVGKFGRQALWMGSVEGQRIFTQLLGGETADYIGAVRVFGIADKLLFEQLTRLDNQDMVMGWQLMTHPMNSNPWPAAFVNFKASIQVFPVSIPGRQAFLQWKMELLTEPHAAAHMTNSMNDIMEVGLSNLTKYMEKTASNSGGSSSGSHTTGVIGSSVAPQAYGVQYMQQPTAAPTQTPSLSQALNAAQLTGSSTFLQQPSFVPAPGQDLSAAQSSGQSMGPPGMGSFQQLPMQSPLYGQFAQQQFGPYQPFPQMYQQHMPMLQQQHPYQHLSLSQQQQQQQLQQQLQQQAQQLALSHSLSGGSSLSGSQRDVQRNPSGGSQRGSPRAARLAASSHAHSSQPQTATSQSLPQAATAASAQQQPPAAQ